MASLVVPRHGSQLIPTGISLLLPTDTYGRIASRSGLAVNAGIEVGGKYIFIFVSTFLSSSN